MKYLSAAELLVFTPLAHWLIRFGKSLYAKIAMFRLHFLHTFYALGIRNY